MTSHIEKNMPLGCVELWKKEEDRWSFLARACKENSTVPAFTPALLEWLVLNHSNQDLSPGSKKALPQDIQHLWDKVLVFPLKNQTSILGGLIITAQEDQSISSNHSEILATLANHISTHFQSLQKNLRS